ncbi:MAG: hypothetical protein ACFFCS_30085 [Candidatus Hodarchaeota archaeon]
MTEDELTGHIIITGSRQAGISSFVSQKAEDFEAYDEEGMGIDIQTTNVTLDDGKECHLHFYEIAGTFPLDSLRKIIRKKTVGLAIMFDLNNTVSLELAEVLFKQIQDKLHKNTPTNKFLLGSHSDLERKVEQKHVDAVLTIMGEDTHYLEFSAKTGDNLLESLEKIARVVLNL